MSLRLSFVAVLLCLCAIPMAAMAQSLTLNQVQGAPLPDDGFAVMRPVVPGSMRFSARLHLDYANDPLVFEDVAGQSDSERTSVVRDQLSATAVVALGATETTMVYAGFPIDLLMKGDSLVGLPRASGTGLGDLYFGGRYVVFAPKGEEGPMIAIDGQLTLPSAKAANSSQRLAGESKATGVIRSAVEFSLATLRVNLVGGLRFRPDVRIGGIRVRDEVLFEMSLMQALMHDRLFAHVEVFGKSALDDFGRIPTTPISAQLGLRLRQDQFTFGLAGGAGVMRGYGAPDARVMVSMAISVPERETQQAPDEPADPVEDDDDTTQPRADAATTTSVEPAAQDAEAVRPQQRWLDSDGDTIRDADDQCPRAPGTDANNGCPQNLRLDLDAHVIEVLKEIRFNRGGTQVLGNSFETLEELLAILNANPDMHLSIEAYTHNEDAAALAFGLTQSRAGSIRDLLLEWGAEHERITALGCGSQRPIAPNDKSWGRKKNERIELRLTDANTPASTDCHPAP